MPPMRAGGPAVSTGGAGFPLAITSASKHPDVAAAYIDWMTGDHASDLLLRAGQIPLHTGASTSAVQPGTVLSDVVNAATALSKANGVVPYEDWATPTFYDTLTAAIQELMGTKISPQQFVARVQKDYADFQSSRT
jgi:raffinose/stachyose/melibiose transport system substrate-binding protein